MNLSDKSEGRSYRQWNEFSIQYDSESQKDELLRITFCRIGLDEGGDLWTSWNLRIPPTTLEPLGILITEYQAILIFFDQFSCI